MGGSRPPAMHVMRQRRKRWSIQLVYAFFRNLGHPFFKSRAEVIHSLFYMAASENLRTQADKDKTGVEVLYHELEVKKILGSQHHKRKRLDGSWRLWYGEAGGARGGA